MRYAVLIAALMLAGCNNAGEWENEQAELANELNGTAPAAESNGLETDYLNTAEPAANDVNATAPADNDVNTVAPAANETTPPPAS